MDSFISFYLPGCPSNPHFMMTLFPSRHSIEIGSGTVTIGAEVGGIFGAAFFSSALASTISSAEQLVSPLEFDPMTSTVPASLTCAFWINKEHLFLNVEIRYLCEGFSGIPSYETKKNYFNIKFIQLGTLQFAHFSKCKVFNLCPFNLNGFRRWELCFEVDIPSLHDPHIFESLDEIRRSGFLWLVDN